MFSDVRFENAKRNLMDVSSFVFKSLQITFPWVISLCDQIKWCLRVERNSFAQVYKCLKEKSSTENCSRGSESSDKMKLSSPKICKSWYLWAWWHLLSPCVLWLWFQGPQHHLQLAQLGTEDKGQRGGLGPILPWTHKPLCQTSQFGSRQLMLLNFFPLNFADKEWELFVLSIHGVITEFEMKWSPALHSVSTQGLYKFRVGFREGQVCIPSWSWDSCLISLLRKYYPLFPVFFIFSE
jgi:hypothetical protein